MYKLNTGPLSSATAAYSNISFSVFFCEKFVRLHCIELLYIVSYIRLLMEEINGTTYFYYLGLYFFPHYSLFCRVMINVLVVT